ncbi:hypothetical protein Afil01_65770 [Actinorhabdospora filicis]|uniref:Uncharacterized protein n=1 Tax=Actinorhabdospora filicis TaxID=1785913 RepID=A0A9W6WED4_9ACTN|nr:hypothetical protein [Actinorhabdospora filicis]GLZ81770.1 hypothetical protein Afil01_65770 [Actinorhabdospora filicis]
MGRTCSLTRDRVLRAMRWTHVAVGALTLLAAAGAVLAFGLESLPLALAALVLALAAAWTGMAASRFGGELRRARFFEPESRLGEAKAGAETWLPALTGAVAPGTGMVVLYLVIRRVGVRISHGTNGRRINWVLQFGSVEPEPGDGAEQRVEPPEPAAPESPVDGGRT